MGWNDFSLPVAGTQFENEDGPSRQEELTRCAEGEAIMLEREPSNPFDSQAVAVLTSRFIKVGYIPSRYTCWLASKIDRGYPVRAIIERIKGARLAGSPLGLVIRLNMEGDMPQAPIEAPAGPTMVQMGAG